MKEKALELSPNIKHEFLNLSHYLGIDKATQMRSYYLFEEFIQKSPFQIQKQDQSLYLRVATYVSCKSMTYLTKEGKQIRGLSVFANSFLKEADFGLDKFIQGLKQFKQVVNLDSLIEEELNELIRKFSFF